MNELEIEKVLQKISDQKMFGETEKAIANLHILNKAFPKEKSTKHFRQVLILIRWKWRRNYLLSPQLLKLIQKI